MDDQITKKEFTWGKGVPIDVKPMAEKLAQLDFMPMPGEGEPPSEKQKLAFELLIGVIEEFLEDNKEAIVKRAQEKFETIKSLLE